MHVFFPSSSVDSRKLAFDNMRRAHEYLMNFRQMENVIKCESNAQRDWSAAGKNLINKLVAREKDVYFGINPNRLR